MTAVLVAVVIVLAVVLAVAGASIRVLREYERAVIFRLGRLIGAKGPGIVLLIPLIDRMVRVDLRTVTFDIPPQDLITRDNVPAKVNAVAYFRVVDPIRSVVEVERYRSATSQIAQTTLRSVLGKADLDHLLAERERLNEHLQQIIDEQTDPWGIKVTHRRDQGRRASRAACSAPWPGRPRRSASGARRSSTPRASFRPPSASSTPPRSSAANPAALQLRYLQTLLEVSNNQSSTIVLPVPTDLLRPLLEPARAQDRERPARTESEDGGESERLEPAAEAARPAGAGTRGPARESVGSLTARGQLVLAPVSETAWAEGKCSSIQARHLGSSRAATEGASSPNR